MNARFPSILPVTLNSEVSPAIVIKVNTLRGRSSNKKIMDTTLVNRGVYGIGYAGDSDKDMFDQKFSRCLWHRFPIPYRKTLWFDFRD
ncbi:hypothetical protein O9993_22020 [Vibrio lentus]|nr:hypothetical protein [Vibrio lentus]